MNRRERWRQIARCRKLAHFLRTKVPKERFNMDTWGDVGFDKNRCGTTACAFGWAPRCFPRLMSYEIVISGDESWLLITARHHPGLSHDEVAEYYFGPGIINSVFLRGSADTSPHEVARWLEDHANALSVEAGMS